MTDQDNNTKSLLKRYRQLFDLHDQVCHQDRLTWSPDQTRLQERCPQISREKIDWKHKSGVYKEKNARIRRIFECNSKISR